MIDFKSIKTIVFDFGGVILEVDKDRAVNNFVNLGIEEAKTSIGSYRQEGIFKGLEDGSMTREEFYKAVNESVGKVVDPKGIDEAWKSFVTDIGQYKLDLIAKLKEKFQVYMLSNTSPIMMEYAFSKEFSTKGSVANYFHKLYLSYEIGVMKPEREIYNAMIKDSGLVPSETLFLDDGEANIEIAKALGFKTYMPKNGENWLSLFDNAL